MKGKQLLVGLLSGLCLFGLSGCAETYTAEDIEEYVHTKIGLQNVIVSEDYTDIGDSDRVWDVYDTDSQITFQVLDAIETCGEFPCNSLNHNFPEMVFVTNREKLPDMNHLNYVFEEGYFGAQTASVHGWFSDVQELEDCYEELCQVQKEIKSWGYGDLPISWHLYFDHPMRYQTAKEITDGDSHGDLSESLNFVEMREQAIQCMLDYGYEDLLKDVPEDWKTDAIAVSDYRVGVYQGSNFDRTKYDTKDVKYYDDMVGSVYGYGISFSNLYKVLEREGFSVTGNPSHYSVQDKSGNTYEFSYDFVEELPFAINDDTIEKGYYYLLNGEVVPMNASFYNHFSAREIEDMFGIPLVID